MNALTPQSQQLLQYLLTGRAITRIIADSTLGIAALPRRIRDLVEAGYAVVKETKRDFNKRRYSSYSMTSEEIARVQKELDGGAE